MDPKFEFDSRRSRDLNSVVFCNLRQTLLRFKRDLGVGGRFAQGLFKLRDSAQHKTVLIQLNQLLTRERYVEERGSGDDEERNASDIGALYEDRDETG